MGATVEESYAILGEYDFLVIFEAPDAETAFTTDIILERHGLAVQTVEAIDTESFSRIVDDLRSCDPERSP